MTTTTSEAQPTNPGCPVHGPNATAYAGQPDPHLIEACRRVRISACAARIPQHFLQDLERNQKLESCCRNAGKHQIGAYYTSEMEKLAGVPDVYILYCQCGRAHRRLMTGPGKRPFWGPAR